MGRLEVNDFIADAYITATAKQFPEIAERLKKIYEVQRVEIMANEEVKNENR